MRTWPWDGRATPYVVPWRPDTAPLPAVRRIELADLRDVLARGLSDFGAYRTDVIFLCIIYPLAGLVLAWLAFGYDMVPLLFPSHPASRSSARSRRWVSMK